MRVPNFICRLLSLLESFSKRIIAEASHRASTSGILGSDRITPHTEITK